MSKKSKRNTDIHPEDVLQDTLDECDDLDFVLVFTVSKKGERTLRCNERSEAYFALAASHCQAAAHREIEGNLDS